MLHTSTYEEITWKVMQRTVLDASFEDVRYDEFRHTGYGVTAECLRVLAKLTTVTYLRWNNIGSMLVRKP
jgi:hypothetical protein